MKLNEVVTKIRGAAAVVARVTKTLSVDWRPVRKVAASAVAVAIAWGALRLGVDLGPDSANQAALALIGAFVGWLVPEKK